MCRQPAPRPTLRSMAVTWRLVPSPSLPPPRPLPFAFLEPQPLQPPQLRGAACEAPPAPHQAIPPPRRNRDLPMRVPRRGALGGPRRLPGSARGASQFPPRLGTAAQARLGSNKRRGARRPAPLPAGACLVPARSAASGASPRAPSPGRARSSSRGARWQTRRSLCFEVSASLSPLPCLFVSPSSPSLRLTLVPHSHPSHSRPALAVTVDVRLTFLCAQDRRGCTSSAGRVGAARRCRAARGAARKSTGAGTGCATAPSARPRLRGARPRRPPSSLTGGASGRKGLRQPGRRSVAFAAWAAWALLTPPPPPVTRRETPQQQSPLSPTPPLREADGPRHGGKSAASAQPASPTRRERGPPGARGSRPWARLGIRYARCPPGRPARRSASSCCAGGSRRVFSCRVFR